MNLNRFEAVSLVESNHVGPPAAFISVGAMEIFLIVAVVTVFVLIALRNKRRD